MSVLLQDLKESALYGYLNNPEKIKYLLDPAEFTPTWQGTSH